MGCIVKTIGRLLFVTLLISSAYLHLTKPQNFAENLSTNYSEIVECVGKHVPGYLPPVELVHNYLLKINWKLFTKVLGLFEGLTAILIVFGDCWGGFFLLLNLLASGYFDFKDIQSIVQWEVSRQLQVYFLINKSSLNMFSSSVQLLL